MFTVLLVPLIVITGDMQGMQRPARPLPTGDLKIVVIAGEDAVNIVQQKTAVAPIVEVRDRNDVPVAGAAVTFAIQGGKTAAFGGASTLTVATNAAGQAVATGFSPLAAGAVQVNVQAAFQGQIAVATLTQTNVMTAAQAAAVTAGGASGTSTGGAATGAGGSGGTGASAGAGTAAGGGGGLSATTIGIVGAAAAGGALVAVKAVQGGGGSNYTGTFAFEWTVGCLLERMTGTLTVSFDAASEAADATLSNGRLSVENGGSNAVSAPPNCGVRGQGNWGMSPADLTGTLSDMQAHQQDTVPSLGGGTLDRSYDFRGTVSNGAINGTFGMTWRSTTPPFLQSSGTGPVTLSRAQ